VSVARSFKIKGTLWLYQGQGAWHFVTLPKTQSDDIRLFAFDKKSAWGSVRVNAKIGRTQWKTSLFPDTKAGAYLLPIKAEVRKKEKIGVGSAVSVVLTIGA
jgi:Domain of unknown function (DUF1905)